MRSGFRSRFFLSCWMVLGFLSIFLSLTDGDFAGHGSNDHRTDKLRELFRLDDVGKGIPVDEIWPSNKDSKQRFLIGPFAGHLSSPDSLPNFPITPYCSDVEIPCQNLSAHCFVCDIAGSARTDSENLRSPNCTYGELTTYTCRLKGKDVRCQGETTFEFTAPCRYCYQTDTAEHSCIGQTDCHVAGSPYNQRFRTNCTVHPDVVCLGHRVFYKMDHCNYSSGYRWSTALLLSITVGGFGADRFYLGHWREGIGKLFSFGGLGVWTVVDILLIAVGYLRPDDGSIFIDF